MVGAVVGGLFFACSEDRPFSSGGAAGASGAAGEGDEPTAGSTSSGGNVGNGDSGAAGDSSSAGGDATDGRFAVVEATPADSAIEVERDESIAVVFSHELDPDSLSGTTFQVSGPSGAVDGDLSVERETITFTPSAPWVLLGEYSVTLRPEISSKDGEELGEVRTFSFRTRDGVFRKPERIFNEPVFNLRTKGTKTGHVLVDGIPSASTSTHKVAVFNALTQAWQLTTFSYSSLGACLNDHGEAFVLAGDTNPVWSRLISGLWSTPKARLA